MQRYKKIPTYASIWGIILLFSVFCNGNHRFSIFNLHFPISNASMFLDACVLFHGLRRDGCRHFRGVIHLRVSRGRTDSPPCLAGRKPHASNEANQHQKSANKLSHLSSRIWLVIL